MSAVRKIEPSLAAIVSAAWKNRIIVGASVVAGLFLFTAAYLFTTPVYEASTSLIVGQNATEGSEGAAKRPLDLVNSQARIAESDEVIRAAINKVGFDDLGISQSPGSAGLGGLLRQVFSSAHEGDAYKVSTLDVAAARIGRSLSVRTEPNSDVIKIVFRHTDPVVAAKFANAMADAFIERQLSLLDRPGAANFFRVQADRFDEEVERRSAALEAFMKKEATFSVEDQRGLLMKRASELQAAVTGTRSSLAEKQGQKAALVSQLKLLKPVTQSSYVSGLVDNLAASEGGLQQPPPASSSRERGAGDPPLLMVKVYQDAMVGLFKINSEIRGLQDLAEQQQTELSTLNAELVKLAGVEAEFARLKREVALASYNAELYSKRTIQEQIDSDLRSAKLSSVRVIQKAQVPIRSAFPKGWLFLMLGLAFGAVGGVAAAVLKEYLTSASSNHASNPTSPSAAFERRPLMPTAVVPPPIDVDAFRSRRYS